MKILFLTHCYFPAFGGSELLIQTLAERLTDEYNHTCKIFTSDAYSCDAFNNPLSPRITPKKEIINNVEIRRFTNNRNCSLFLSKLNELASFCGGAFNDLTKILAAGPCSFEMLLNIINDDSDIIIATAFPMAQMYYAYIAKKTDDKKIIIQGNFHINNPDYETELNYKIINSADFYVCLTNYEYSYLTTKCVDIKKIKVIKPALITPKKQIKQHQKNELKNKLKISIENKIILYFGQINGNKNLKLLIDAFSLILEKNNDCILIIAGAGHSYYRIELENYINLNKKMINKIKFFIDTDEFAKQNLYYIADIFVNPSANESFCIAALEAMAYGLALIVSDNPQPSELIENNVSGLLFENNNKKSLADVLTEILNDDDTRADLGLAAREKFNREYNQTDFIFEYNRLCNFLVNKINYFV